MRSHHLPLFILTITAASAAHAGVTSSWIGPSGGNWNAAANWSAGVPGSPGVPNATISAARGTVVVNLNTSPSLGILTIGPNCTLVQPNSADLNLAGLVNDGIWSLNSSGSFTDIGLSADFSVVGSGAIQFSNATNNRIYSIGSVRTLTNGPDHTIRGAGNVGSNNTGLVNEGLIEATLPAGLILDMSDSLTLDNNGLLRARNGSTLTIFGTNTDNADGTIRAEDGSIVSIRFGSVTGGVLESLGSGEFTTTTEVTTFVDTTLNGLLRMPNGADSTLSGTLTNNGTWSMESAGSFTDLVLNSPTVTLAGPGTLAMSDQGNNRVLSVNAVRTLVNGPDHTIRGAGNIGGNNTGLINDGLIEATLPAGLMLDMADSMTLDNNGLLRARDGSTLTIFGTTTNNVDGTIRAEDGSIASFRFGSVTGGVLESLGSGEFTTTTEVTTFVDTTLNGLLRMPNGADSTLSGTLTNNGTWSMESSGSLTDLSLNSPTVTLAGPGTLAMSDHGNNRILSINAVRTLVNGPDHTIRGAGNVGGNNTGLVNEGLIEATLPAGLILDMSDSLTLDNNGLLRARNGSTLTIFGTNTDNADGTIRAEDGSIVSIRFGSVTGGVLESLGSGEFTTTTEVTTFVDTTLNGLLRMPNGADSTLSGTLTNNGTWSMESAGSFTDLVLNSPTVTLAGTGTLAMTGHPNNRVFSVGAVRTLVNAFGHTIRGGGALGGNNTAIQNKGVIEANQSTALTIDPQDFADNFNEGTMRVTGNGTMVLGGGAFVNRGLVDITPTRTLSRTGGYNQTAGETRVNGTFTLSGGSYAQTGGLLSGDGTVIGAVSVQGGSASPSNADGSPIGELSLSSSYAQGADGGLVIDLGFEGNDRLAVTGNAQLGGALQVRLVDPFVPFVGQEFTILTASNINGLFGCVEFPNAAAGYFRVVYSTTSVKLVVDITPPQEADLDFDGIVGASDLGLLLGSWGTEPCDNAICCPSDLNGDGIVDALDLAILLGDWG